MELNGCSNAPICNDGALLKFRGFDADDGDALQIRSQSIGGHVFQINAVALLGAIDIINFMHQLHGAPLSQKSG